MLENKYLVSVGAGGKQIVILRPAVLLKLTEAANLYAHLRFFLMHDEEGRRLAEQAWHDINEQGD